MYKADVPWPLDQPHAPISKLSIAQVLNALELFICCILHGYFLSQLCLLQANEIDEELHRENEVYQYNSKTGQKDQTKGFGAKFRRNVWCFPYIPLKIELCLPNKEKIADTWATKKCNLQEMFSTILQYKIDSSNRLVKYGFRQSSLYLIDQKKKKLVLIWSQIAYSTRPGTTI